MYSFRENERFNPRVKETRFLIALHAIIISPTHALIRAIRMTDPLRSSGWMTPNLCLATHMTYPIGKRKLCRFPTSVNAIIRMNYSSSGISSPQVFFFPFVFSFLNTDSPYTLLSLNSCSQYVHRIQQPTFSHNKTCFS